LGAALFDEPRPEKHEAVRALMWRVIYRSPVDARWVKPLLEIADAHETESKLLHEYLRLFGHSDAVARPYGSYWLEPGQAPIGRTTLEVSKLMRRYGVSLDHHPGMLPDHLVAELECMAHLIERDRLDHTRSAQQKMIVEHLGLWVPRFAGELRACAPSRFYRMATHYLNEVIAWDARDLKGSTRRPIAA
jgi:TorA maturation chaperone TorD